MKINIKIILSHTLTNHLRFRFDTELYKKEQELEKMRQEEFRKKIKNELDRQLAEKKRRTEEEKVIKRTPYATG